MIKKLLVAVTAMVMMAVSMQAATATVNGITWTYTVSGGKASISDIPATTTGAITIPSSLGGYPVTSIGGRAFYGCSGLTSVTIPNSVASIGNSAFNGCNNITSVHISDINSWLNIDFQDSYANPLISGKASLYVAGKILDGDIIIPNDVKSIPAYAFRGCSGLTSVTIPDSVTSIGGSAFSGCSGLTSVTIPNSVTTIGNSAFSGCSGLTSVTIPNSVTSIGNYAFHNCSGLTSVTIPNSVTTIGNAAFYGCRQLRNIVIPNSVTSIGSSMFWYCHSLTSVTIPNSVTIIGDRAFYGCSSLTNVTIPNSVTTIRSGVFYGCSRLKDITIPNSVIAIANQTFFSCISITNIVIPNSVSNIMPQAFQNCRNLKNVIFKGLPPNGLNSSCILDYGAKITIPYGFLSEWLKVVDVSQISGYLYSDKPIVEYVSVKIRENDPTILDCVYRIWSNNSTVKVRALAFEDGVRSFNNVIRPVTFIEGTETNIGDTVAANVEHKLSWRVSADYTNTLAKLSFEVLATENHLLPLELTKLPKTDSYPAMEVSWNVPSESDIFSALLWLYANGDNDLTLIDGMLVSDYNVLAEGTNIYTALSYIFSKMGFSTLSGDSLEYAKKRLRLELPQSDNRQYAFRILNDE